MSLPKNLRFTKTHEWVKLAGDVVVVGITDFAQEQLGDLTYVELPRVGDSVSAGDEVAVVESVKAASDVYAPVSGNIQAVNEELVQHPEIINADPYTAGWLFKITPDDPAEVDSLLSVADYEALMPEEE
jgi:glycine cleavage system H protein